MQIVKAVQLAACAALLCVALGPRTNADSWDKKTIVTFSDSVEIPGQVLPPGTYVFKLFNSMAQRHIVQIWNGDESQLITTIQAIPIIRSERPDSTLFELDERPADLPQALHAWFYPGETTGNEFVYSRSQYSEVSATSGMNR